MRSCRNRNKGHTAKNKFAKHTGYYQELTTLRQRRDAALHVLAAYEVSQTRACRLVSIDPKTVRRKRDPDCPEIKQRMLINVAASGALDMNETTVKVATRLS